MICETVKQIDQFYLHFPWQQCSDNKYRPAQLIWHFAVIIFVCPHHVNNVTTRHINIFQKFKSVRPISYPKNPILFFVFDKNKIILPRHVINDDERNMWFDGFCSITEFIEIIKPVYWDKNKQKVVKRFNFDLFWFVSFQIRFRCMEHRGHEKPNTVQKKLI